MSTITVLIVSAFVVAACSLAAFAAGRRIERLLRRMTDLEKAVEQVNMKRLPHDVLQKIEDVNAVLPEIELHQEIVTAHLITMQRRLDALRDSRMEQERTRYGNRRVHPEELT